MRSRVTFAVAVLVLGFTACHDDGLEVHGCPTEYEGAWTTYGLSLEHIDPTRCPVFIHEPAARLTTGATVVDQGVAPQIFRSRLTVFNASGFYLDGSEEIFREDVEGRWISPIDVSYPAGSVSLQPDKAYYDLELRSGGSGPSAVMTISYTNALVASISGPGYVQESGTYTWSASIATGAPPYTYRWYRDWDLVGTGSSYTGRAVGDTIHLRLDVRDSRGEVDSYSRNVLVNHCRDGARVC